MFRVGQKVVCISRFDKSKFPSYGHVTFPVKGSIYVIRDIVEGLGFDGVTKPGLVFEEIINPISSRGCEYSFMPTHFRPLIEHKTDISIFTAMLKPSKVTA